MTEEPIILIVDDSENDALLVRTVFGRAGFTRPLQFVRDGVEAVAYLAGDGSYSDRARFPLPAAVLLDLNMPRKNGFEVLGWIRQQAELKRLCVFVLSASNRPEDIRRAYDLGANSYLVKPGNLDGLMHLARCLNAWLKLIEISPVAAGHRSPGPGAPPARAADQNGAARLDFATPVASAPTGAEAGATPAR
jgi:CheY-like chemotaxis protein